MTKQDIFEFCYKLAESSFQEKFRRDGNTPYFEHPKAVADMFDDWIDKTIAILHDCDEDTWLKLPLIQEKLYEYLGNEWLKHMEDIGIIISSVRVLSHDKETKTYKEYLYDIVMNGLQRFKIADITANLADAPSDYQKEKYKKAMKILLTPWINLPTL